MKYIYLFAFLLVASPLLVSAHPGNTDSNGGHYCRTNCDKWGVPWNQWHSHGGSSYTPSSNYYSAPTTNYYTAPAAPVCPANSYSSGSSCKCNYGYVVSGSSCVNANAMCRNQIGLMSSYDSLSQTCKCDYGYVIGSNGSCVYKSPNYPLYSGTTFSDSRTENSCPANSKVSISDPDKCTCNLGYEANKKKNKCVKIKKSTNDKICRADYGSKSEWTGKYDKETESPFCGCKKKYEWNSTETSCIKS